MTAGEQSDRRRAERRWCRHARGAIQPFADWPQPRPSNTPGQAVIVEPGWVVVFEARGENLSLPGTGRCLETFELLDDGRERIGSLHARLRCEPLPGKQEAQKVPRGDRFDLGAQPLDRIVVDSCEQPPVAPFFRDGRAREAATQGKAFRFERAERGADCARLNAERRC